MHVKKEVLTVLNDSRVENNILFLPPTQFERKLYQDVNKVLEMLGGKWNRKQKGHVFKDDIEQSIEDIINFGEVVDKKKELQYFPTPLNIAKTMLELLEMEAGFCVLEPSAGTGDLIKVVLDSYDTEIMAYEIDNDFCKKLSKAFPSYKLQVRCKNFLEVTDFQGQYARVLMNPPFSKQQDIDHILHAYKFLNKGGVLVSIISESPFFRNNKKSIDFRDWLCSNNAEIIDLESGAFKESGTMIKARIIKLTKGK